MAAAPSGGPFVCDRRIAAKGAKLGQRRHAPSARGPPMGGAGRGFAGPQRPIGCLHFLPSHRGSPRRRPPRWRPISAGLHAPPPRGRKGGGGGAPRFCFRSPLPSPRGGASCILMRRQPIRRRRFGGAARPALRRRLYLHMHEGGVAPREAL